MFEPSLPGPFAYEGPVSDWNWVSGQERHCVWRSGQEGPGMAWSAVAVVATQGADPVWVHARVAWAGSSSLCAEEPRAQHPQAQAPGEHGSAWRQANISQDSQP